MPKGQFDAEAFYAALDSERLSKKLTWKKVAERAGVSASTLTRMAQGKRPDVDSMAALLAWSGLDAELFIKGRSKIQRNESDPLTRITTYLRADPNLTPAAATALEAVIKATYERLRKE